MKFYDCEQERLDREKLALKLAQNDDVFPYTQEHNGKYYTSPSCIEGSTTIDVLEFLKGMPLDNLALAYIHTLRPSVLRISTDGGICTDSWTWRVTVFMEPTIFKSPFMEYKLEHMAINRIEQEVAIPYACGADIDACLRERRKGA